MMSVSGRITEHIHAPPNTSPSFTLARALPTVKHDLQKKEMLYNSLFAAAPMQKVHWCTGCIRLDTSKQVGCTKLVVETPQTHSL